MHSGAPGSGAPPGNKNALKHGRTRAVPWGPFCSVKMARQILEGLGLEIAKPDEARDILALRGPDKVPF